MRYLNLDSIKRQVTQESEIDDILLSKLGDAAEQATENHLGRTIDSCIVDDQIPPALMQAMLMFVATLYDNRESISFAQPHMSPAYEALIGPYRRY